jgi:hypothetical protein
MAAISNAPTNRNAPPPGQSGTDAIADDDPAAVPHARTDERRDRLAGGHLDGRLAPETRRIEPSLSPARTRSATGPLVTHEPVFPRGKPLPQEGEQAARIAEEPLGYDAAVRRLEPDVGEGALGEEAFELLVGDQEARVLVGPHAGADGRSAAGLAFVSIP